MAFSRSVKLDSQRSGKVWMKISANPHCDFGPLIYSSRIPRVSESVEILVDLLSYEVATTKKFEDCSYHNIDDTEELLCSLQDMLSYLLG